MNIDTVTRDEDIPKELINFKISHYREIFNEYWEDVYRLSPSLKESERELLVLNDLGRVVGGCSVEKGIYGIKFWDFSILPGGRGKGYGRIIMNHLEEVARSYHNYLINSGNKPNDISLMFLRSLIYVDSETSEPENPLLQFSSFLKSQGFFPYVYNKNELSESEVKAVEIYGKLYPELSKRLRVFKKKVVDGGIELSRDVQEELLALAQRPDKWDIVMNGLEWKLGNYGRSGRISYRYDLCPICKDVGSSEVNSDMLRILESDSQACSKTKDKVFDNCQKCYIYQTCMMPFRDKGRFKEDFEVSHAYFSAMRDFMLQNPKKGRQ